MKYYVMSDLHGHLDHGKNLYNQFLEDMNADDTNYVVFLGDYVDRGPDSCGVVDWLMSLESTEKLKHVFLRGNHEEMMLESCDPDIPSYRKMWLTNGGQETLQSYGLKHVDPFFDIKAADKKILVHLEWMKRLPYFWETKDYFFVHAGVLPALPLDQQAGSTMCWIRDKFLNSDFDWGKTIVHGHTPVVFESDHSKGGFVMLKDLENFDNKPLFKANRINVDTGLYIHNRGYGISLPDRKLFKTGE